MNCAFVYEEYSYSPTRVIDRMRSIHYYACNPIRLCLHYIWVVQTIFPEPSTLRYTRWRIV